MEGEAVCKNTAILLPQKKRTPHLQVERAALGDLILLQLQRLERAIVLERVRDLRGAGVAHAIVVQIERQQRAHAAPRVDRHAVLLRPPLVALGHVRGARGRLLHVQIGKVLDACGAAWSRGSENNNKCENGY